MTQPDEFEGKPFALHVFNSIRSKIVNLKSYTFVRTSKKSKKIVDELIQQNALKDRLLAIISHDVRSPLDSLKMLLPLLADRKLSHEEIQHVVSSLDYQVDQLSQLLENTLRWVKGHSADIKPFFEELHLEDIVHETIGLIQSGANRKQVHVDVDILESTVVVADGQMIRVVLRNLLTNAIKFCKAGDRVSITSREVKSMLAISVRDTGRGISPLDLPNLFTLSHTSTRGTNSEIGMGVGLTLCKEFVEKMGGEITATSVEGTGSCFEFTLHTPASATPDFLNFIESTRRGPAINS